MYTIDELREELILRFMKNAASEIRENDDDIDLSLPDIEPYNEISPSSNLGVISQSKYLTENQLLSDISIELEDLSIDYTLKLCIYHINNELPIPFLQYMCIKNETSKYDFPKIELNRDNINTIRENSTKIQEVDDNDDISISDEIHSEILEQCSQLLSQVTGSDNIDLVKEYRGYIKKSNELYIFIDCTKIIIQNMTPVTINEIIEHKKLLDIEIENDIIELFNENAIITNILDNNNKPLLSPVIAYICKLNEQDEYENVYITDTSTLSLINPTIEIDDETDDEFFIFSLEPLTNNYINISRYALYMIDVTDMVNQPTNTQLTPYITIDNEQSDIKLYGVSSIDVFIRLY
jgi:hypothetical protein